MMTHTFSDARTSARHSHPASVPDRGNHEAALHFTVMAVKLSPSLKHLLALRNPNPLPCPPSAQLRQVLSVTYRDAQNRKAETGWLVLSVICTFAPWWRSSVSDLFYRRARCLP